MSRARFLPLLLAPLLGGCILSVEPFHAEKDLVVDDGIVGVWKDLRSPKDKYLVHKKAEGYLLISFQEEKPDPASFALSLFELGGRRYADLSPADGDGRTSDLYVPSHMILRLESRDGVLELTPLRDDAVLERLADGRIGLAHSERKGDWGLLTASTKDLRAWLEKAGGEAELWRKEPAFRLEREASR